MNGITVLRLPLLLLLCFQKTNACLLCLHAVKITPHASIPGLMLPPLLSRKQQPSALPPIPMHSRPALRIENSNEDMSSLKELMLEAVRWYRRSLSPLMPPNCRFFPSCSNYALQVPPILAALCFFSLYYAKHIFRRLRSLERGKEEC